MTAVGATHDDTDGGSSDIDPFEDVIVSFGSWSVEASISVASRKETGSKVPGSNESTEFLALPSGEDARRSTAWDPDLSSCTINTETA